jgi:NADPH:quinone reductase-like Zn-dependent oxidoreductase
VPCAAVTAWVPLTGNRRITGGDTVLTQGSGGVSVFALRLARVLGARVIATTSTAEKAERLKALGAAEVIKQHVQARLRYIGVRRITAVPEPTAASHRPDIS